MIWFYSGTPGSGKSLSAAKAVLEVLTGGKNVIAARMSLYEDKIYDLLSKKKNLGTITQVSYDDVTPKFFYEYALKNHLPRKEGQTYIFMDEVQLLLGPTVMKLKSQEDRNYRRDWLEFMTQHRHLGFHIIMISQFDRLVDPQIRTLFEYNIVHRKINHAGTFGWFLSKLHINLFMRIEKWYGNNCVLSKEFFRFSKKYASIYDSYSHFSGLLGEHNEVEALNDQRSVQIV